MMMKKWKQEDEEEGEQKSRNIVMTAQEAGKKDVFN